MTDFDLAHSTIAEISRALADGVTSAVEIVDLAFDRIEKLAPALNAFVCLTWERGPRRACSAVKEEPGIQDRFKRLAAYDSRSITIFFVL